MENFKRDLLSRRSCFVLNSLLAIIPEPAGFLTTIHSCACGNRPVHAVIITGKITDDKGAPLGEVTIIRKWCQQQYHPVER